jgi:hypothetical protein
MILVTELTKSLYRWVNGTRKAVACTESAAVMAASNADPAIPSRPASPESDALALLRLGHHTANGGRTRDQIMEAMLLLWRHQPRIAESYADALDAVRDGAVLMVAGDYFRVPGRLKIGGRFGRAPGAYHEVTVGPLLRDGPDPVLTWRDPLGKKPRYRPSEIAWSSVVRFALAPTQVLIFDKNAWLDSGVDTQAV